MGGVLLTRGAGGHSNVNSVVSARLLASHSIHTWRTCEAARMRDDLSRLLYNLCESYWPDINHSRNARLFARPVAALEA